MEQFWDENFQADPVDELIEAGCVKEKKPKREIRLF
jgi:hypothetical protein